MAINDSSPGVPINVPGWPLARIEIVKGTPIVILAELNLEMPGRDGELVNMIICPHCRRSPLVIARGDMDRRDKSIPSCGCRKGFGKNPDCSRQKKVK